MNHETLVLETRDLKIGYASNRNEDKVIASGLSLALNRGEMVCLLGPNGAGKSTLIRSLSGVDSVLTGTIELNGDDVSLMSARQRARLTSVVLTDALPAGMFSVFGLVALGRYPHSRWTGRLSAEDRERIDWAMGSVGIRELAMRQFSELSDGERQKVLIARALAQEAAILMLDEPTAFVDLPRRVELMQILAELAHQAGIAILLSSHDLDLSLRCADKLWLMNSDGGIVQGCPEDLALGGQIAAAFESDTVDWDSEEGCFRLHRTPYRIAHLEGEGNAALWTRRALARKGYGLGKRDKAELEVIVTSLNGRSEWRAGFSDTWKTFDSLESLFSWIESE